jgi:hypothetical protein
MKIESKPTDELPYSVGSLAVKRLLLAPKILRHWADFTQPGKFIPPLYAELADGTIAVATNLYDCCNSEVDDPRYATWAVFCIDGSAWTHISFTYSELDALVMQ